MKTLFCICFLFICIEEEFICISILENSFFGSLPKSGAEKFSVKMYWSDYFVVWSLRKQFYHFGSGLHRKQKADNIQVNGILYSLLEFEIREQWTIHLISFNMKRESMLVSALPYIPRGKFAHSSHFEDERLNCSAEHVRCFPI